jgi:hypothetical protein
MPEHGIRTDVAAYLRKLFTARIPSVTALPSQLPPPQEQLLLHELNHRIGNEFCCAISVVSLAAARSGD